MADNRFYLGWTSTPINRYVARETEKAYMVSVDLGYWGSGHDGYMWIPKSIMKISKPNENGAVEILIPYWWVAKNQYYEKILKVNGFDFIGAYRTEEEDGKILILKDGKKKPFGEAIW